MGKRHMKTLAAPVSWVIKRKQHKLVIRPLPGKLFFYSMPIALIFKNLLKYCKTLKEVKAILRDKEVLVDGKRRKEPKYPIGLMDVLSIPVADEHYRLLINRNKKLFLLPISKEEAKVKICKITGKTKLAGGKMQLNLHDSRNLLVKEDKFSVGDSILISLPDNKIKQTFKLDKGKYVFLIKGSNVGNHGIIDKVENNIVQVKVKDKTFETPKKAVFVIGNTKPEIKIE